jgi:GntR family transcriptional regulator
MTRQDGAARDDAPGLVDASEGDAGTWRGTRLRPRRSLAEQAAADLRSAIRRGVFGADGTLPSEATLTSQLGVSRPTVRQAISILEQEGLVVRRQGLGTFVQSTVAELPNLLNNNAGITDMIESAGYRAGTKKVLVRPSVAGAAVAGHLSVEPGAEILVVERTRTADDRPVAFTRDFIRHDLLRRHGITAEQLGSLGRDEDSLYGALAGAGVTVQYGVAKIRPAMASKELAQNLEVAARSQLLLLEQTDFEAGGVPILFSEEYLTPSNISIFVFRRGPG